MAQTEGTEGEVAADKFAAMRAGAGIFFAQMRRYRRFADNVVFFANLAQSQNCSSSDFFRLVIEHSHKRGQSPFVAERTKSLAAC